MVKLNSGLDAIEFDFIESKFQTHFATQALIGICNYEEWVLEFPEPVKEKSFQ